MFGTIEAKSELIGAFADLTTVATFVMLLIGGTLAYLGFRSLQTANVGQQQAQPSVAVAQGGRGAAVGGDVERGAVVVGDQNRVEVHAGITYDYSGVAPASVDPAELERTRRWLEGLPLDDIPERGALPQGFVMPLRPNPHFVGRREDLKRIAGNLKAGGATAVGEIIVAATSGLGGVGKTQLACDFVYRYGRYFHGVYWLTFGDPVGVPTEIASCGGAGRMDLRPDFHTLPLEERVQAVMAEWQTDLPRLLVFDNCEDEGLLDRWLPPTGGCRVLVTSRRGSWDPSLGVTGITLDVLSRRESVALLREHCCDLPADDPDLDVIAEELGDLPLALDLAGRYLRRYARDVTAAAYLSDIRRPELLEHPSLRQARGISPTKHDMDVWRTFAMSYWKLDADDGVDGTAVRLLARAARLTPGEPIPDGLLAWTLEPPDGDGEPPRPTTTVRDALDRLTSLGLLEGAGDETLRLHRLVAAFVLSVVPEDGVQASVEAACSHAATRASRGGLPRRLETILPHLRFVTDAAAGRMDYMAANCCTALGVSLGHFGAHDEALPYAERAWEISVRLYGPEDPVTLQRRSNTAALFEGKRDRVQARTIYEEVLEAQERVLGQADTDVAATLNNLGASLARDGLYHETLPRYRRALQIRKDVWDRTGPEDPARTENAYEASEAYGNMGALMMDLGRCQRAIPHLESALTTLVGEFGENHERNAGTLVMLGSALRAMGDRMQAATSVTRALDVYEIVVVTASPAVSKAFANLGSIIAEEVELEGTLADTQILELASGLLRMALTGSEGGYGEDHPMTGGLVRALGAIREAQGAVDDARRYRERAEACRRLNLRGGDAEAAGTISEAARSLMGWGLYDEAQAYLERALTVREDILGELNFDTSTSFFELGILHQIRGSDAQARQHLKRALDIRAIACGQTHPATELVRENLSLLGN